MIIRWLIGVCAALAAVRAGSLLDEQEITKFIPGRRNITEKTGAVCAFADFDHDRLTDVVHYHKGKLLVVLQRTNDFKDDDDSGASKYTMPLGEEYAEVACSVGDINGDGYPDVVASLRKEKDGNGVWTIRAFVSDHSGEKMVELKDRFEAKHQVALIDVTGNGLHDVLGVAEDGGLLCRRGEEEKTLERDCSSLFPSLSAASMANDANGLHFHALMPTLFGDVDGDRYAELIFMMKDKSRLVPQIWQRSDEGGWSLMQPQLPPPPTGVSFQYTLAPMLADIDMNARMDLLVPVCKDSTCTVIENLQVTSFNADADAWEAWTTVAFDVTSASPNSLLVNEKDTLVRMKIADFNLDGYPDILVTFGTVQGGTNYPAVLENKPVSDDSVKRRFVAEELKMLIPGLSLGMIQSSFYFDFAEDGYLDILTQWKLPNDGGEWQWSMVLSDSEKKGDVTFLKVQTFAPLQGQEDIKNGAGVVWGGVCATYEMETTGIGEKRRQMECQIPGNSHKAGLSPPFVLFGLGRSPNFVDIVDIGVPRATNDASRKSHQQKQIVPNARMMVQPPNTGNSNWVLRLYLTPSSLIFSSLLVMASTCTILLIVVLILHFREKKVDRVERAAQSHRFHFDAM